MKSNPSYRLLVLLFTALFIMACALPGLGAPAPDSASPGGDAPGSSSELCANQYYPVRQGATWSYKATGGTSGEYAFTDTISSARANGFTLTTQFTDLTRTQEWECRDAGLVALQLGGGTAAALNTTGSSLVMETQNAQGVTFPRTINAGDTWQHTLDFTGTMDIAGEPGTATGNAQSDFTALGTESVTVPAGTFNAMKVQANSTININATFQGVTLPVTFSGTTTLWLVEGVGWVKAVADGSFGGAPFNDIIELQTYNIP